MQLTYMHRRTLLEYLNLGVYPIACIIDSFSSAIGSEVESHCKFTVDWTAYGLCYPRPNRPTTVPLYSSISRALTRPGIPGQATPPTTALDAL